MATDLERLVVQLEATTNKFQREINKAHREANRRFRDIERRATNMEKSVGSSLSGLGKAMLGVGAAIAGSRGAQMVAAAAAQYTSMQNALKATGIEGKALESTFSGLFQIAQKNGTEMAPLVTLYSRMSLAQKELGATSGEMLQFTESVSLALKVQGSSTQEASGALLQLSQAMGGGKIQAEEYNSLIDGAPALLKAVAAGMKEAGGSVAELTRLVKDGKVSSEAFFRAALAGMPTLEQASSKMAGTVDQSMNQIKNAFSVLIGELNDTTGASANAATNLRAVAQAIETIPQYIDAAAGGLAKLQGWLNQVGNHPFWRKLGTMAGVDFTPEGIRKNGMIPLRGGMSDRVGDAWELNQTVRGGSFTNYANTRMGPQLAPPKPVSLADYAVKDGKSGKAKRAAGGKSDEETRHDQVERYIGQLERQGRVLQAEFDTLGKSNAERAKAIELARIGTVTDRGQLAAIDKQVAANEKLRSAIEDAKKAQESMNEVAQFAGDSLMNVFDDLIDGSGNLTDSIKSISKALASAALQAALLVSGSLGNLFGMGGKDGGVGGLLGMGMKALTGGSFSDGGFTGCLQYTKMEALV